MSRRHFPARTWLTVIVLAHLLISLVHGTAHSGAQVAMSPAGNLFVFVVILAGPLAGLALSWWAVRPGSWLIAVTLAGALVFGVVNHFVVPSADHVTHVARQWRLLFASTAVLLAVTEALGAWLALRVAHQGPVRS